MRSATSQAFRCHFLLKVEPVVPASEKQLNFRPLRKMNWSCGQCETAAHLRRMGRVGPFDPSDWPVPNRRRQKSTIKKVAVVCPHKPIVAVVPIFPAAQYGGTLFGVQVSR